MTLLSQFPFLLCKCYWCFLLLLLLFLKKLLTQKKDLHELQTLVVGQKRSGMSAVQVAHLKKRMLKI
jgi:hypothetical protein